MQHCTSSSQSAHQKMFTKLHIPNYLKNVRELWHSRTLKYAGILIPAHYLLRKFFGALSANSPYSVAKNSIWNTCRLVVPHSCNSHTLWNSPTSRTSIIMYYSYLLHLGWLTVQDFNNFGKRPGFLTWAQNSKFFYIELSKIVIPIGYFLFTLFFGQWRQVLITWNYRKNFILFIFQLLRAQVPFQFICQVANILAGKDLTKWVQPRGNWTYDLRLFTHLNPTTNATRLLSHLRFEILELVLKVCCSLITRRVFKEEKKYHLGFQRLNSDGNFFERYDYNIP